MRLALELHAAERAVGTRSRRAARPASAELLDATDAAISHEEWDAANAAFHEHQVDLAGNALLSRFYRELSVNLMMQVIRGGQRRGPRVPRHRAPRRSSTAFEARRPRGGAGGDPRARRHRPPDRARRDRAGGRRALARRRSTGRATDARRADGVRVRSERSARIARRTDPRIDGWRRRPPARPTPASRSSRSTRRPTHRARARAPGRVPVHARPVPGHVPRPAVDDAPVRRLRLGRGDERALPLPARARARPGLSVAFDLPTQLGYDSDDPLAAGEVGRTGRRDRLARRHGGAPRRDPARRGLDLDDDQRAGRAPAPALRARRRGAGRRRATRCAARSRTTSSRSTSRAGTTSSRRGPSMRLTTDLFAYCAERLPRWNTISISGYHIREAGSTRGAGARVHARERDRLLRGGGRGGPLARRLRRAALVLLQRAQPLLPGGREVPRRAAAVGARSCATASARRTRKALALRFHAQTGGSTLTAQQPENNIVRVAIQALSAVCGGAQSLHTNALRRGARAPDRARRHASRCARSRSSRTRPATTDTADPLGGSYFVEALTDELEERARELIARIDELGGAVAAIEQGFVQARDRGVGVPLADARSSRASA